MLHEKSIRTGCVCVCFSSVCVCVCVCVWFFSLCYSCVILQFVCVTHQCVCMCVCVCVCVCVWFFNLCYSLVCLYVCVCVVRLISVQLVREPHRQWPSTAHQLLAECFLLDTFHSGILAPLSGFSLCLWGFSVDIFVFQVPLICSCAGWIWFNLRQHNLMQFVLVPADSDAIVSMISANQTAQSWQ